MTDKTVGRLEPGAKSNATPEPPFGVTGVTTPVMLAMLSSAAAWFNFVHPGSKPTRAQASLFAGTNLIVSEPLMFGFVDASIVDTPFGWATSITYRDGIDWTTPGNVFTERDLRLGIPLAMCGAAARALFGDYDMLGGNIDMLGIACMVQRRSELTGCTFKAVVYDAVAITARILQYHRFNIETAAAIIEREGTVTHDTSGVVPLLDAASATPIMSMPPAPEQARKLAGLIGAANFDLEAFAREFSILAIQEARK